MKISRMSWCALTALICAGAAGAQTIPILFNPSNQKTTTPLIGFATNQSARLSVLNLNPPPPSGSAAAVLPCSVKLEFLDITGRSFAQTTVTNLAPQTGTILDVTRNQANPPGVTATVRAQIRGLVTVNPTPAPTANPVATGPCSVAVTLEILDANGSTVALTTDNRSQAGIFTFLPPGAR